MCIPSTTSGGGGRRGISKYVVYVYLHHTERRCDVVRHATGTSVYIPKIKVMLNKKLVISLLFVYLYRNNKLRGNNVIIYMNKVNKYMFILGYTGIIFKRLLLYNLRI